MPDLPVMLKIAAKRCVIVGGGAVARRRAAALAEAQAQVIIIATTVEPDSNKLFAEIGATVVNRPYQPDDLQNAWLVVAATDNPDVNQQITQDAQAAGVLVNRVDDHAADGHTPGDLTIPAHAHHGPVTLAVHTGGASPAAAGMIRRQLSDLLDPDWPLLLELIAPYRDAIRNTVADPADRRERLIQLAGQEAMDTLKQHGPHALHEYCNSIVESR